MLLDPERVAPVPWRNGGGVTRELATRDDDDGDLLWRISLASLEKDARFSTFPGMDRIFVALGDLDLVVDGSTVRVQRRDQIRFRGEADVQVSLDYPTQALNVMMRRGRCSGEVVLRATTDPPIDWATATVHLGELAADVLLAIRSEDLDV